MTDIEAIVAHHTDGHMCQSKGGAYTVHGPADPCDAKRLADALAAAEADAADLARKAESVPTLLVLLAAAHSAIHSGEPCGLMHAAIAAALEQG